MTRIISQFLGSILLVYMLNGYARGTKEIMKKNNSSKKDGMSSPNHLLTHSSNPSLNKGSKSRELQSSDNPDGTVHHTKIEEKNIKIRGSVAKSAEFPISPSLHRDLFGEVRDVDTSSEEEEDDDLEFTEY